MLSFKYLVVTVVIFLLGALVVDAEAQDGKLRGWDTNTDKALIDLSELRSGGPPKDGIPSIDNPSFEDPAGAASWLDEKEPVIALEYKGEARAYPLQILIWHEIVNDRISGDPLLVTFCPLCYSALVFDRRVDDKVLEFGVSGFLRHSDLVMYDRSTETLWQQFTGKAIVGDYVGTRLEQLPSQIISFEQFRENYPGGKVLSKNTGYRRSYGANPYAGYDDINNSPMMVDYDTSDKLPPMEKVIGVKLGDATKTYPYSVTREAHVINDRLEGTEIVVFHLDGAKSALDASQIAESREDGSTGVFRRTVDGQVLTFELRSGAVHDTQTGSRWNITGKAVEGELTGTQLEPVTYGDYFAFAWLVFWPDTEMYTAK
ncbi:MAG: DUF3179 domain-containing protein [Balneolaceae bacterium]|nr:DUF3179 domain-containing protein [Balneolaceae bacterium]